MIEVEIKLPVSDRDKLGSDLEAIGFAKGKLVREEDIYFTSEMRDFKKRDEAFRIRRRDDQAVVTYKGPKIDQVSMTRKELETGIEDADVFEEILGAIGFKSVLPVKKLRRYYRLGNMTACVDQVEELGDFLELEVIVPKESERENALNQIESFLERLGHNMAETTRRSYLSMLQENKRKEG